MLHTPSLPSLPHGTLRLLRRGSSPYAHDSKQGYFTCLNSGIDTSKAFQHAFGRGRCCAGCHRYAGRLLSTCKLVMRIRWLMKEMSDSISGWCARSLWRSRHCPRYQSAPSTAIQAQVCHPRLPSEGSLLFRQPASRERTIYIYAHDPQPRGSRGRGRRADYNSVARPLHTRNQRLRAHTGA